jgi:phage terminase small subunit
MRFLPNRSPENRSPSARIFWQKMKVLKMPGNYRSGRRRKPIAFHLAAGTYRRDRHGPLKVETNAGKPTAAEELPAEMVFSPNDDDKVAKELYDHLYPLLAAVLLPSDTPAFTMLCELWSLYQQSLAAAKTDPTAKAARTALLNYLGAFDRLAARFGLTPADRARLQLPLDNGSNGPCNAHRNRIPKRDRTGAARFIVD